MIFFLVAGYRGYGCNDKSMAESEATEKLAIYLLTLSNLAFLPGMFIAFYRRLYIEALVYTYNMFFSTVSVFDCCIYHYHDGLKSSSGMKFEIAREG